MWGRTIVRGYAAFANSLFFAVSRQVGTNISHVGKAIKTGNKGKYLCPKGHKNAIRELRTRVEQYENIGRRHRRRHDD